MTGTSVNAYVYAALGSAFSTDGVNWNVGAAGWSYGPVNALGGGGGPTLPLIKFREMYSYSAPGLVLGKRLWAVADNTAGAVADTLEGS